jgi:hypothetical protein
MRRRKKEGKPHPYRGGDRDLYNSRLVASRYNYNDGDDVERRRQQLSGRRPRRGAIIIVFYIPLLCAVCVYVYYPVVKVERYGFCSAYLDDNRDETIPHCVQAASIVSITVVQCIHTHTLCIVLVGSIWTTTIKVTIN